jgi:hypothetical protein
VHPFSELLFRSPFLSSGFCPLPMPPHDWKKRPGCREATLYCPSAFRPKTWLASASDVSRLFASEKVGCVLLVACQSGPAVYRSGTTDGLREGVFGYVISRSPGRVWASEITSKCGGACTFTGFTASFGARDCQQLLVKNESNLKFERESHRQS